MAASQDEVDLFEINTAYASTLYERAATGDWKALERLARYELMCIPGFEVERQKRTDASVFDVFVRLRGNYLDFRRELGSYILGECKDWQEPVGSAVIAYLAQNLTFHECTAGVLFSWRGITGTRQNKDAALTVLRAYHHSGKAILVLDRRDFQKAARGEALQEILRRKYEEGPLRPAIRNVRSHARLKASLLDADPADPEPEVAKINEFVNPAPSVRPASHDSRADSRKPASLAVALYCGIGSSSLKALVKAFDRLHMVRGWKSSNCGWK